MAVAAKTDLNVFVPITKIDVEQRLIYGVMAAEQPDRVGEVLDYFGSKPNFQKWSGDQEMASGGKSKGNVRGMHSPIAAGKLTDIFFDDANKRIEYVAKIVDDQEWRKVEEGVYTGVSIGGKYASRTRDPMTKMTRFVAKPGELSLVDVPCYPGATFDVVKADGTLVMQKRFVAEMTDDEALELAKSAEAALAEEFGDDDTLKKAAEEFHPDNRAIAARADELAKAAGKPGNWVDFITQARKALIDEHSDDLAKGGSVASGATDDDDDFDLDDDIDADLAKALTDDEDGDLGIVQEYKTSDGRTFSDATEARDHAVALKKVADERNDPLAVALAKAQAAFSLSASAEGDDEDGIYADPMNKRLPLNDATQIQAAWTDLAKGLDGYSDDQLEAMEAVVRSAYIEQVDEDGPPPLEKVALVLCGDLPGALDVLSKRFIDSAGSYGVPSLGSSFYVLNRLSDAVSAGVGIVNEIDSAKLRGEDLGAHAGSARDALAAMATLLADATHTQVVSLLGELGDGYDDGEGDEDDVEKADLIVDLAKMDGRFEVLELDREVRKGDAMERYNEAWEDVIGVAPPSAVGSDGMDFEVYAPALTKVADNCAAPFMANGLYIISTLAQKIAEFKRLVDAIDDHADCENDSASLQPRMARDILISMGNLLVAAAHEEVGELVEDINDIEDADLGDDLDDDAIDYIHEIDGMAKDILSAVQDDDDLLEKIGARTSRQDMSMVQAIHDHAEKLGAACGMSKAAHGADEGDFDGEHGDLAKGVKNDDLAKIAGENETLKKRLDDAIEGIGKLTLMAEEQTARLKEQDEQLAKLKDMPAPIPSTRAVPVSKQADQANGSIMPDASDPAAMMKFVNEMVAKMPQQQRAELALKFSHMRPMNLTDIGR